MFEWDGRLPGGGLPPPHTPGLGRNGIEGKVRMEIPVTLKYHVALFDTYIKPPFGDISEGFHCFFGFSLGFYPAQNDIGNIPDTSGKTIF